MPSPPPATLPRPRLTALLDEHLGRTPVVLLRAPVGYGKTQLLSAWLAERPELRARTTWVCRLDGDPAGELHRLLAVPPRADGGRPLLVVDDLEVVAGPALQAALVELAVVRRAVDLVLSSRTVPLIPVGLLVSRGELAQVDDDDLALTREEVEALRGQPDALPADVLLERTQGWPAAVRMLVDHGGDHRLARVLASYVDSEVLDHLPGEDRRLLQHAALLPVLDPAAAEAVTGHPDALARLTRLHESGVPVRWAAPERPALNPLVRERLLTRLQQEDPQSAAAATQRAAQWLHAAGRPLEAARLLVDAGEHPAATALLAEGFVQHVYTDTATVRTLLEEIPEEGGWLVTMMRAVTYLLAGDSIDPAVVLATVENRVQSSSAPVPEADQLALTSFRLLMWRSVNYRQEPDLALLREGPLTLPVDGRGHRRAVASSAAVRAEYGFWLLHHGELAEAGSVLNEAVTLARLAEVGWLGVQSLGAWGCALAMAGQNEQARDLVAQAEALASATGVCGAPLHLARLGRAATLVDDLRLAEARDLLDRQFAEVAPQPEHGALLTYLDASIRTLVGHEAEAVERIASFRMSTPHLTGYQRTVLSMGAFRALLELGRLEEAEREVQLMAEVAPPRQQPLVDLSRARLLVKQGRPGEAVPLLRPYLEQPTGLNPRELLGMLATTVVAAERCGDDHLAEQAQHQMNAVSDQVGVGRGTSRQALLMQRLRDRSTMLSPTELKVLRQLDSERSLAEVAATLFVSANTLKTHLRSIYRKLNVPGRRQAVERARLLNLI